MIKPDNRNFTWDDREKNLQKTAEDLMSEIAEEHNIEITSCGGSNFYDVATNFGYEPTVFNVEHFNEWKNNVSQRLWSELVKIEKEEMKELVSKYRNTLGLGDRA